MNNSNISINVKIKINDPNIDISYSDFTIGGGGSITNLYKNNINDTFEASFNAVTPYLENTLSISENTFTDGAGNGNNASNIFSWTWNKARPSIVISSLDMSNNGYKNNTSIKLLFTPSESINNFIFNDISHNGFINEALESSGNNYIVTLFAYRRWWDRNAKNSKTVTVVIPENTFKDSFGNFNTSSSNIFIWNYNGIKPEITITSDTINSGAQNNLTQIDVQFTFTKLLIYTLF